MHEHFRHICSEANDALSARHDKQHHQERAEPPDRSDVDNYRVPDHDDRVPSALPHQVQPIDTHLVLSQLKCRICAASDISDSDTFRMQILRTWARGYAATRQHALWRRSRVWLKPVRPHLKTGRDECSTNYVSRLARRVHPCRLTESSDGLNRYRHGRTRSFKGLPRAAPRKAILESHARPVAGRPPGGFPTLRGSPLKVTFRPKWAPVSGTFSARYFGPCRALCKGRAYAARVGVSVSVSVADEHAGDEELY